jgi:hypothetical protein
MVLSLVRIDKAIILKLIKSIVGRASTSTSIQLRCNCLQLTQENEKCRSTPTLAGSI